MYTVQAILMLLLNVYLFILVGRIVVEMIQSFSRQFRPPRWFAILAEPLFVLTDPPVKALRRIIPPLKLGAIALDMSILVLFFILYGLMWLVQILPVAG